MGGGPCTAIETLAGERLTFDQLFGLVPSVVQLWNDCLRNMNYSAIFYLFKVISLQNEIR